MAVHQLNAHRFRRDPEDTGIYDRGFNIMQLGVWIANVKSLLDLCMTEERWGEVAFWGQVLSDLLERRLLIEEGADARKEISTYEDVMAMKVRRLNRIMGRDEERFAAADAKHAEEWPGRPLPAHSRRARSVMDGLRQGSMECWR